MPRNKRYLLVVDDEEIIRDAFARALQGQTELILDTADTIDIGIQKVRSVQWDLVFLDMKLGGDSTGGLVVLEELRLVESEQRALGKLFKSAWVIIMSSSVCLNDITPSAHEMRVYSFIDKPVEFTPQFVRGVLEVFSLPLIPSRSRETQ